MSDLNWTPHPDRLTDAEFEADAHVDDCHCLRGQADLDCVLYRGFLASWWVRRTEA